jgi:nitroreductase
MSTITEIIKRRRSHYPSEFNGERIPEETVRTLLENAHWAPTHLNTFPWRFIVIRESQVIKWGTFAFSLNPVSEDDENQKKKRNRKTEDLKRVSHVLAIVCHFSESGKPPRDEELFATACAVQNIYLSLDLFDDTGGYWSTGYGVGRSEMHEYLGLDENERLMGFFMLGCVSKKRFDSKRPSYESRIRFLNTD